MCGFAGFIAGPGHDSAELQGTVDAMAACVGHRGPDDSGTWADAASGVALGFRRLAIVDLTAAGHQPFVSADGRFVLVFNGEIYNHGELRCQLESHGARPWVGHSDTETLIAAIGQWGLHGALQRATGMFAVAVWDRAERRLQLARDRFGEKPLYYGWTRGAFVFGSELHALQRYPAFDNVIDRDVVGLYTRFLNVPAPYSIYRGIYKLEPGCVLSLTRGTAAPLATAPFAPVHEDGLVIERYWSLVDAATQGQAHRIEDESVALDQLDATLRAALRAQSVADVPLGAFLSGGIDSSVIVALMQAESGRRVKTFTLGFEEAGFNEAAHASAVAKHLDTDHTEVYVSPQQARDLIPRLPAIYTEPFGDSSQLPTHLVSIIARRHVTVALSGDGGDELFGGYRRYLWGRQLWRNWEMLPRPLRRLLGASIHLIPVRVWDRLGRGFSGRPLAAHLGDTAHRIADRFTRIDTFDELFLSLVTTWPPEAGVVTGARPLPTRLSREKETLPGAEPEHRMMLWDALAYMTDDVLHKVDRAAMAVGLETRAPLLDHHVAELAWALPLTMKIRDGQGKYLLRRLLYRHVPPSLIDRPKMGFGIPVQAWLRGPLREWAEDLLSVPRLTNGGFFDPAVVRQRWTEHLSGARDWNSDLWCILMFQAWQDTQR